MKKSTKALLVCGIISSLYYVALNIFVPMHYPGYSSADQTVSELSAIGAPTRTLWIWASILYTVLVAAFGCGVWRSAGRNQFQRVVGGLIFFYAVVGLFWPFAPMHQRAVLAANGATLSDTMHLVCAAVTVLTMILAIGFGAVAFGKGFRNYSVITISVLLGFGILTAMDAPSVQANLATPWTGVWERINIGVFLLWVIVLAVRLLRVIELTALTARHKFKI